MGKITSAPSRGEKREEEEHGHLHLLPQQKKKKYGSKRIKEKMIHSSLRREKREENRALVTSMHQEKGLRGVEDGRRKKKKN